MTHRPQAQADGDPGVDRTDVAIGVCALVAMAQEAGVSCLVLLRAVAETWDEFEHTQTDTEAARHAADRITG